MSSKMVWVGMFACVASACAAKAPVSGSSDDRPVTASRDRNLITQADLDADPTLRAQSVIEVIRALRPQFLNDHGTNTLQGAGMSDPEAGKVHVSIDNGRIVPLSELSGMHGGQMIEIRYLNVAQAMQKFGTAARQGPVILVITTR
ncbi:MAG TPA: hypothetical protein VFN38_14040 [Gemmatimonadaceae bacterium]|nr:hypothetical protein [Gemmatimonadaceae bacterium]